MRYTPGPWKAVDRGDFLPPMVKSAAGAVLATVESVEVLYTRDGSFRDEEAESRRDNANAMLMAAAPTLLAAAQEVLEADDAIDFKHIALTAALEHLRITVLETVKEAP